MEILILLDLCLSGVIVSCIIVHFQVKYRYNNGTCRKCGHKIECFDVGMSGDIGFKCTHCGRIIWI